jgi:hypothetical protein
MAAEGRSAAPRYCPDRFQLLDAEGVFVDEAVGLSTENIGHLEGGPAHWFFLGRRLGLSPSPEIGRASMGLLMDCR